MIIYACILIGCEYRFFNAEVWARKFCGVQAFGSFTLDIEFNFSNFESCVCFSLLFLGDGEVGQTLLLKQLLVVPFFGFLMSFCIPLRSVRAYLEVSQKGSTPDLGYSRIGSDCMKCDALTPSFSFVRRETFGDVAHSFIRDYRGYNDLV